MRFQVELPDSLMELLAALARENFRTPKQHVTFLLADSITRAARKRDAAHEQRWQALDYEESDHAPAP